MKICLNASLAIALVLVVTGIAGAVPVAVDDPFESNSWNQPFQDTNATKIDHIQMQMVTGSFEQPGATSVAPAGWTQTFDNGMLLTLDGPAVFNVTWTYAFNGAISSPVSIKYESFLNSTSVWNGYVNWDGNGNWTYPTASAWQRVDPAVPEPITMLGAFAGVGSVAGYIRRRQAA